MRFLFFATLVTSALAIDSLTELMDQLPKCSIECLTNALSEQGCSLTDVQCACSNVQAIVESASPCLIIAGCALDELSSTSFPIMHALRSTSSRDTVCLTCSLQKHQLLLQTSAPAKSLAPLLQRHHRLQLPPPPTPSRRTASLPPLARDPCGREHLPQQQWLFCD